jgi:hypothetical protein
MGEERVIPRPFALHDGHERAIPRATRRPRDGEWDAHDPWHHAHSVERSASAGERIIPRSPIFIPCGERHLIYGEKAAGAVPDAGLKPFEERGET